MVQLTKIYTRGGDKGETSLGNGARVTKTCPRIDAIGHVDELNASIGLCALYVTNHYQNDLKRIQNDLFDLGGDLCIPDDCKKKQLKMIHKQVDWLEQEMDRQNEHLPPLTSFILPGGSTASSHLHLARCIARRAERAVILLSEKEAVSKDVIAYLNRLSDYLFVLCRTLNDKGSQDVLWVPGKNQEA